ncbi:MAG: aminopeptidase N [Elusimicrobia bacterium]|nr:aminopeptidase N [Elusimicrobiota bacterium]
MEASLSALVLLAAALSVPAGAEPPPRPAAKGLSRAEAAARARRVSEVRYRLFLHLPEEEPEFTGIAAVEFDLADAGGPLTLDFAEGRIARLRINGGGSLADYNGLFVTLPAAALRAGRNSVEVEFTHPYSSSGSGLHRMKDPADGRVYAYTDFEPYDANRAFPCFDQPDLKASFELTVEAPQTWEVISAARESEIRKGPPGFRRWAFPPTPRLSPYVFSVHAGPYAVWTSSAGAVPLRLFARQSMARHVEVDDWLDATRRGLEFFSRYYDAPYPFGKYDQVIVPDFNSGAMENVGAATFSERFLARAKPTWRQREEQAAVILHELAHMWFGNLVTMTWWDDLWLNESFASYMSALALAEATEFADAWQAFFLGGKQGAYWEDELSTTHPIEADVPDTEQAAANFDGITYGKGASSLKLAAYLLGEDSFREGVRRYLKKRAFGNAERKDFMAALAEAAGKPLDDWTREWLQTAGLNTLRASFACEDGAIAGFSLVQGAAAPDWPDLRGHRAAVALYREESGRLRLTETVERVDYSGTETPVPALDGKPCPALVIPNHGDHDYAKVKLDLPSVRTARASLSDVDDPLDRAILWTALWNMVRDQELDPVAYADLLHRHLPREKSFQTAARVVETVYGRGRLDAPSLLLYLGDESELGLELRAKEGKRLEELFWGLLQRAEAGGDFQKLWLDTFIRVSATPEALERLDGLLAGRVALPGLELDQDRRWELVVQLNRWKAPKADRLLAAEARRDGSRRGQTNAIRAEAVRPEARTKEKWLRAASEGPERPLEELRSALRVLFPPEQAALRRRFADEFYARLKPLMQAKPNELLREFAESLVPATCRPQDGEVIGLFLRKNPQAAPIVRKKLKIARQENARCAAIRARAMRPGPGP